MKYHRPISHLKPRIAAFENKSLEGLRFTLDTPNTAAQNTELPHLDSIQGCKVPAGIKAGSHRDIVPASNKSFGKLFDYFFATTNVGVVHLYRM